MRTLNFYKEIFKVFSNIQHFLLWLIQSCSSQGNDNGYHFLNEVFLFFIDGFDFSAELDEPYDFERCLAYDFSFVCSNQKTHSHANKTEVDLCVLVVPCGSHTVINFELF